MSERPLILMVEDEDHVMRINSRMMTRRGYEVICAENFVKAWDVLQEKTPDLLILDIMLPDGNGFDLCKDFRKRSDNPVIFLTGKDEIEFKVDGLGMGGDYYLTKPYDLDELMAVSERLLKRHFDAKQKEIIAKGSLTLNLSKSQAEVNGQNVGLTAKEFALLLILVQNEGQELSHEELYEKVWGRTAGSDTRTVRFHITNLRKKLDADNAVDFNILSIYGKGYSFSMIK